MPQFSCDGCNEVVKKAKLDMHSYQCNWFPGSFSCIDCSLQCTAPAQWKAHTSCITEKEKYHGNFYTPKKNGKRPADQNSSQQPKKQQKVQHEAPAAKPEAKKKKEKPKSTSSTTGDQAIAWADLVESTLKESSKSSLRREKLKRRVIKQLMANPEQLNQFLGSQIDKEIEQNKHCTKKGDKVSWKS